MSDYGPIAQTPRDTSSLLRFTDAMRWPREQPAVAMPDEDDLPGESDPIDGRLREIEARIAKLAERFDQLEFIIVEQFEPGMTETGDLPAGNLRDRLDRIEAGLGLLRTETPDVSATRPETSSADVAPGPAGLEARTGEMSAPLADTTYGPTDALHARLEVLEKRLETAAEAAAAQLDKLLSAIADEATGWDSALQAIATSHAAHHADLKAALAAETETWHAAVVTTLDLAIHRAAPAPDSAQQQRNVAGLASALQTTFNQFEVSIESILDRLEVMARRLEALEAPSAEASEDPVALPAPGLEASLAALADGLGALVTAAVGEAARDRQFTMEDQLRDLRLTMAEIAADSLRARVA